MTAVFFLFAIIFLVWGLIEWRLAIKHAIKNEYLPPIDGAAKWLICFSIFTVLLGVVSL